MSVELTTSYLGIELKNPLGVAACPPLTGNLDALRRLEDAGASIAVMPSLFEEQIVHEELEFNRLFEYQAESFAEAITHFPAFDGYNAGPNNSIHHIEKAKQAVKIPIVGSLNGASPGGWTRYARMIADAGADALELNIYFIPTEVDMTAADVEQRYVDLVASVRQTVQVPLAVKIGNSFSSLPNFARQLVEAGADGLVLFNRYVEADIDLEALEFKPDLVLSNRHEVRTAMRWIAILRDQLTVSLAATSGVHRVQGVLKALLAGADVTMMASILLMRGPTYVATLLDELKQWLEEHEYASITQLKGSMSRGNCPDPGALERANYMKALTSFSAEYSGPP